MPTKAELEAELKALKKENKELAKAAEGEAKEDVSASFRTGNGGYTGRVKDLKAKAKKKGKK